jgi:hypothetical protein
MLVVQLPMCAHLNLLKKFNDHRPSGQRGYREGQQRTSTKEPEEMRTESLNSENLKNTISNSGSDLTRKTGDGIAPWE